MLVNTENGFLSTLSSRRATLLACGFRVPRGFLSTLSSRRATKRVETLAEQFSNFYPRSPRGERQHHRSSRLDLSRFLSTLSSRRATFCILRGSRQTCDFYPRSPRGERPSRFRTGRTARLISIHALLAESDRSKSKRNRLVRDFYPRSPRGERQICALPKIHALPFLSTLSSRRATTDLTLERIDNLISIHALLAESDQRHPYTRLGCKLFLSTLSSRRATFLRQSMRLSKPISIHALLAESDIWRMSVSSCSSISIHALLAESDRNHRGIPREGKNFYPRSPRGERPKFGKQYTLDS